MAEYAKHWIDIGLKIGDAESQSHMVSFCDTCCNVCMKPKLTSDVAREMGKKGWKNGLGSRSPDQWSKDSAKGTVERERRKRERKKLARLAKNGGGGTVDN